ncbi:MAG: cytochrome c family protein [Armatimonadetes bacterium]|nr:cytochrome c family protein [Armatimonadota bacterium]
MTLRRILRSITGLYTRRSPSFRGGMRLLGWVAVPTIIAAAILTDLYPGEKQPIPFSHYIHATTKQINCFFCHPNAATSSNAGMPSVEKCLLCHNVIATNFQPIRKITDYYIRGESIPWVRVYRLPDFVQFSHQPHIARGFDCSECHGNVKGMDRIYEPKIINMRFCVDCHRKHKASTSCFSCHY